ncbi:MAG: DUF2934 domain-containing protein [Sphingobium sp.]
MADDRDQRIRERAYALWEEDGRQHGRDLLHWDQATREIGSGPTPVDTAEIEAEDAIEVVEVAKAATAAKRSRKAKAA